MHDLRSRTAWIFDMDGTLTVAVHDFAAFKRSVGLPEGVTILEALARASAARRADVMRRLESWERELAGRARPAPGAWALVDALAAAGRRLGVLTRNTGPIARLTLAAAGLADRFDPVLGRDDATPKPSPEGVLRILRAWSVSPEKAVMVGDYLYDIVAGARAGLATVYVDRGDVPDAEQARALADHVVPTLAALLPWALLQKGEV